MKQKNKQKIRRGQQKTKRSRGNVRKNYNESEEKNEQTIIIGIQRKNKTEEEVK